MQVLQAVYSSLSASLHQKWSVLLESHSATVHLQEGFYEERLMLYICRGICEGFTPEMWPKILNKMLFCKVQGSSSLSARESWAGDLHALQRVTTETDILFFFFFALCLAVFNLQTLEEDFHPREVHFPLSVTTLSGQCECTTFTATVVWHHHLALTSTTFLNISTTTLTEIKTC